MKKKYSLRFLIVLMLIVASAAFALSFLIVGKMFGLGTDYFSEVKKYAEAREIVDKYYVGDFEEADITDASLSSMIDSLGDDWSYYLTAEDYETYLMNLNNQYQGIGITYTRQEETNYILIESVTDASPAQEAGLNQGDIISEIDAEPVEELENEEVRSMIISKVGESVELTVIDETGEEKQIVVESKEYYVNPISYEMLDDNVGYVKLANFDSDSGEKAIEAVDDLREQGATALVFDVRNNGGGLVTELLELLDYILPKGELFITADKQGNETIKVSDENNIDMPMSVLVNGSSYSAAEYFAAILQEYDWATVVGEPTTGKGRSQITLELSDGSAIHISSKTYYTPNRVDLSEQGGIVPEYVLEPETDSDTDTQLEKAVQVVKQSDD